MNGHNVGYVRVSSLDQNEARQLADVHLDKIFTDKASGDDRNRPALTDCIEWCREGDTLHVHSIDRLARNLADLQHVIDGLTSKGVTVRFHKENLIFTADKTDPMSTLMLQMMGAFAQFERSMIRERQREGIAAARRAGKQIGARPKLTQEQIAQARQMIVEGQTKTGIAKYFGVSRPTLDKALKQSV